MKQYFLLLILFFCSTSYSQETLKNTILKRNFTYTRVEFSIPLAVNKDYPDDNSYMLLPDGVIARIGVGIKANNWIRIGANFGIDWKGAECVVMAPLYGSIEINPIVLQDFRVFIEPGYGLDMVFGESGFNNEFKKISFGIENDKEDIGIFIELCEYGFRKNYDTIVGNVSIGLKASF